MKAEKNLVGIAYWILIVVLLAVIVVFGITAADFSNFSYSLLGQEKKAEVLKFLGFTMGGVLLALQAVVSHKRARAMEDAARAQAGATEQQAIANRFVERGQRQERLRSAIDHLGSQNIAVRLGARYELFNLAEDTIELRKVVLDILCAYIRETTKGQSYRQTYQQAPSYEIQDLIHLLFIENHDVFDGLRVNLEGSWLNGANFHQARLTKANLQNAVMQRTVLARAQMQGANLLGANLAGAIAESTKLHGSLLIGAIFSRANVINAELQGSLLSGADFENASVSGLNLKGVSAPPRNQTGQRISFDFFELIRQSIDQESDLSGIKLGSVTSEQSIKNFIQAGGATTGAYSEVEACEWMSEFNRIMSGQQGVG